MRDKPIEVFYSYSHKDERFRGRLEAHLSLLQRQGIINGWHDRRIGAGQDWGREIDTHIDSAAIVLLLISADFMASGYCYDIEVRRAMERHSNGDTRVIPVILRACDWGRALFAPLQVLPRDGKPVASWRNQDEAFTSITHGISAAVEEMARRWSDTCNKAVGVLHEEGRTSTGQWVLVFSGSVKEFNKPIVDALVAQLRELSGDPHIVFQKVEQGSVKLTLTGSETGLRRIEFLFKTGLLTEVMGFSLHDVRWQPSESEGEAATELVPRFCSVVFVDLRSLTQPILNSKPSDLTAVMAELEQSIAQLTKKHGGYISQFMGDSVIVAFESDNTIVEQTKVAESSLHFATELRVTVYGVLRDKWARARLGIGIACGTIHLGLLEEPRVVSLAQRLAEHSEDDQILVSENVHSLARGMEAFINVESHVVKGIGPGIPVYQYCEP